MSFFLKSRWHSSRLGCESTLARWGEYGQPVLVFPTAGGDAEDDGSDDASAGKASDEKATDGKAGTDETKRDDRAAGNGAPRPGATPRPGARPKKRKR